MTLKARNRVISLCFISVLPILAYMALKIGPILDGLQVFALSDVVRPEGLIQSINVAFFSYSPLAVLVSAVFLCLLAGGAQIVLYWYFEKTQVAEVFYLSLFLCSLGLEGLRVFLLESFSQPWPLAWVFFVGRTLIFARFFGLFSFFGVSLVSCNQDFRMHGRSSFAIFGLSILVAAAIPLDGLTWLSTSMPSSGYRSMLFYAELAILSLSCISFLAASFIREAPELRILALGAVFVALGRDSLLHGDSMFTVFSGGILLVLGLFVMIRRIHRYYLWM